jgi:hypothetical protein
MIRKLPLVLILAGSAMAASPELDVVPRSAPPAARMVYLDIDDQPQDVRLLMLSLQGLVNRTEPRIYIRDAEYECGHDRPLHRRMRDWWAERLEQRGFELQPTKDWQAVLREFGTAARGALLYDDACWTDPKLAVQLNLISTLCGIEDLLPVTPRLRDELQLPVILDVRGKWANSREAWRWALEDPQIRAAMNRRVLAHRHPWSLYLQDYIVAHRILTLWVPHEAMDDPELMDLHLGGDEAHSTTDPDFIKFFDRVFPMVEATGKQLLGWHEYLKATDEDE